MTLTLFDHDESLEVQSGRVRQPHPSRTKRGDAWFDQPVQRNKPPLGLWTRGCGAGVLRLPDFPRQQRVLVKVQVAKNQGEGVRPGRSTDNWFRHGGYLQREGAHSRSRGLGFDREQEARSVPRTLGQWQRSDPHLYKMIVSPEQAMELSSFTRRLMSVIEADLGIATEWIAIDHYNTGQPHVHLLIRGREAEGHELRIDSSYLWGGVRQRAREVATQLLGMRTRGEIETALSRAVRARAWTELDRALEQQAQEHRFLGEERLQPHEIARLKELAHQGVAWRLPAGQWELSPVWKAVLQERRQEPSSPSAPTPQPTQEHDYDRPDNHQRTREEEEHERQQRLTRVIDAEQEWEWDR